MATILIHINVLDTTKRMEKGVTFLDGMKSAEGSFQDYFLLYWRKSKANVENSTNWVFPKMVVPPNHPF